MENYQDKAHESNQKKLRKIQSSMSIVEKKNAKDFHH